MRVALSLCTSLTYQGSSHGRCVRAAGWFDDLIKEKGHKSIKSFVLLEVIAGWVAAEKEYSEMMDGFDKEV
jgi:arsenical-resistance protein 2